MGEPVVSQLWHYPVKSLQGSPVDRIELDEHGVVGDRRWGLFDVATGKVMSAKRWSALLMAAARSVDGAVLLDLPDGAFVEVGEPDAHRVLSAWLDLDVEVRRAGGEDRDVVYEMTLDPPNDDAELFDIPTPRGTFVDLAHLHLVSTATLSGAAEQHPELDWDVRRFRPNVVVDGVPEAFGEDAWSGREVRIGETRLRVTQPTVRCALPLRAQPGLARQRDLYDALESLHANHLGVYVDVVEPGPIEVGDRVELEPA